MRGNWLIFVLFMVPLTGCAPTEAQREAQTIIARGQAALGHFKMCLSPIENNPRYARIYQKVGVATANEPGRTPSPSQLADNQIVTDNDIALGLDWFAEIQACEVPVIEELGQIAPEFEIYFTDGQAEIAEIANKFVSTRQTFGQVNAQIAALRQNQRAGAKEMGANLKARLVESHQQEIAERAEVAQEVVSDVASIGLALATRSHASIERLATLQSALARAQTSYAKVHPDYVIAHRVKTVHCQSVGRSFRCALQ